MYDKREREDMEIIIVIVGVLKFARLDRISNV